MKELFLIKLSKRKLKCCIVYFSIVSLKCYPNQTLISLQSADLSFKKVLPT